MTDNSKHVILKYLMQYLKFKKISYKKCGKIIMIKCPFCNKEPFTATVLPNTNIVKCLPCEKTYNIIDIVDHVDFKAKEKTDDEIIQHIKDILKLDIVTKKDVDDIQTHFEFYEKNGFDLVPIVKGKKIPCEKDWTNKSHKDKVEWIRWINDGLNLGIKTGRKSNILILDIDQKPIPEELKKLLGNTLVQESTKGFHYFYKYDEQIPKTRIDEYKLDIESEGGQVVIFPSSIKGIQRKILGLNSIIELPKDLKKLLLEKVTIPVKTNSEKIREDIETEIFNLGVEAKGKRNSSLIKLGGIIRKHLNPKQTEDMLHLINNHVFKSPLPYREISAMARELDKYIKIDNQELAHEILKYLKDVESSSKNDIELAVYGKFSSGEQKKIINSTLHYLQKENKIVRRGQYYKAIKSMQWNDAILDAGVPVNFKIPYLNDVAFFQYEDLIIIGSQNKYGKCHAKGTKILMNNGETKLVENIIPGDKIQGFDNEIRTVLDTGTGKGIMYEINPTNNDSFIVNEEHILCLYHIVKKEYQNITVKNYLKKSNHYKHMTMLYSSSVEWKNKKLDIDPYFIGLWLGDGHSANVRITNVDKEIIDYLHTYAKKLNFKVTEVKSKDRVSSWAIVKKIRKSWHNSDSLQQKLRKLKLINNKHIPFNYKINSRKNRLKLLAGLLDSDGYLNKQNNFELSFKNKQLAIDTTFLARSLGFSANLSKAKASYNTIRYRIWISGNTYLIPTKIKRKQALKFRRKKNPQHSGFKIKKLKKETYYGFTLDGDKRYLLDNFIVNHNTTLAMNMIKRFVSQKIKPYYIYNESGARFAKTALRLGMKDGDFNHVFTSDPEEVIFEPNSIVIFDWVKPNDFARTDNVFSKLIEKIKKSNSFLICFVQLKKDNTFFAPNQIGQYPALLCRYLYEKEEDGTYTKFQVDAIRDGKIISGKKTFQVPCMYDFNTKEVKTIEEIKSEE